MEALIRLSVVAHSRCHQWSKFFVFVFLVVVAEVGGMSYACQWGRETLSYTNHSRLSCHVPGF